MAEEVQLPQLGESVEEGIITQWLVEVGDTVEVDQPLVEISTDKVDTEIPSPVAGTVTELRGEVDDTIAVGDVIIIIGDGSEASGGDGDEGSGAAGGEAVASGGPSAEGDGVDAEDATGETTQPSSDAGGTPAAAAAGGGSSSGGGDVSAGEGVLTSPLVRKMLRDADIPLDQVTGTGPGGRITRADAEQAIDQGPTDQPPAADTDTDTGDQPQAASTAPTTPPPAPTPAATAGPARRPTPGTTQIDFGGDRQVTHPITRVRRAIANGMKNSLDTTAQLTAVVEIDMTAVMHVRAAVKDAFKAREGVSLSPFPFIMRAVAMTLPRHPVLNSTLDMDSGEATYKRFINLGMAVDTDRGLLVPNIKDAQDLTITGLAKAIADLASRTRNKQVTPDEISGGTFTVTNTGSMGTLLDTPILNPPEVGILGAAAVEKRPVVTSDNHGDSIAIRHMMYACLSYDHMALDGADAARFLQDCKWVLEHHDFRNELGL
jgi:2-oxoglutarate dehydrogenase E2 component (dihydrolipoamide succinyltransferase)